MQQNGDGSYGAIRVVVACRGANSDCDGDDESMHVCTCILAE